MNINFSHHANIQKPIVVYRFDWETWVYLFFSFKIPLVQTFKSNHVENLELIPMNKNYPNLTWIVLPILISRVGDLGFLIIE